MAGARNKPGRGRPMDFRGFLNNLPDRDHKPEKNDQGSVQRAQATKKEGPPKKVAAAESDEITGTTSKSSSKFYNSNNNTYMAYPSTSDHIYDNILNSKRPPDAASEKELGNEYFKKKKFQEALDCYSRSIALSPTSVVFANRALAYLKVKRFQEAEDDCTEALNLDDRYVKAYSRRAAARKELGKFKESLEDADFAIRLEPNNQELQKQYTEAKSLYEKEITKKISRPSKNPNQGIQKIEDRKTEVVETQGVCLDSQSGSHKRQQKPNSNNEVMQELASRAATLVTTTAGKQIAAPKSAYEFEVIWRALSDDSTLQVKLLKTIEPSTLPGIFKNALSASMLMDIIKRTASFFREETKLAISILENLTRVPRFDMVVMCLTNVDRSGLESLWKEVFSSSDVLAGHAETLQALRSKYCHGSWQAHPHLSNEWTKVM